MGRVVCLKSAILVALLHLCISPILAAQSKPSEMLRCYSKGLPLVANWFEVVVNSDGTGKVTADCVSYVGPKEGPLTQNISYDFRLSYDELTELKDRLLQAPFWEPRTSRGESCATCGEITVRVSLGDRKTELSYGLWREMRRIEGFVGSLVEQAKAIDALKQGKITLEVFKLPEGADPPLSAQRYTLDYPYPLQPYALIGPLKQFIRAQDSPKAIAHVMGKLSYLLDQKQWLSFWAAELRAAKEPRKTILFSALGDPRWGGWVMDKAQRKILVPLMAQYLQQNYRNWPQMSVENRSLCYRIMDYLREERYADMIPILIDMLKQKYEVIQLHDQKFSFNILPGAVTSGVAAMGARGIEAALPYLDDSDPKLREFAVGVMISAVPRTPGSVELYSGEVEHTDSVLKRLREILPRLKRISETDKDRTVACCAKKAVERIEKGYDQTEKQK